MTNKRTYSTVYTQMPYQKKYNSKYQFAKMFTHILCERLTCPILTRQIAGSFFILLQMR